MRGPTSRARPQEVQPIGEFRVCSGRARVQRSVLADLAEEQHYSLEMSRRHYVERSDTPEDYRELFKRSFGPVVATYASLEPERATALDRDFLQFATRANSGPPGGPAEYRYEYLLVAARKRAA